MNVSELSDTDSTDYYRVADALTIAVAGHQGQVRKYTNLPYVTHCVDVLNILVEYTGNTVSTKQKVAALLHDLIEDTPVTEDYLLTYFDSEVVKLVVELTEPPTEGNRETRKLAELKRLATISDEASVVKIADLLSNTRSIIRFDPGFARTYLVEKARILYLFVHSGRREYSNSVWPLILKCNQELRESMGVIGLDPFAELEAAGRYVETHVLERIVDEQV